jgi:putative glutamine amidotransferase
VRDSRPVIAISSSSRRVSPSFATLWIAIRLAGGKPLRIRPRDRKRPTTYDALVLAGGPDVSPRLFGEEDLARRRYDPLRDSLEMLLLADANARDLPVLGICRGAQMINIAAGGTIHPAVHRVYENARYPHHPLAHLLFRKQIIIGADTCFGALAGKQRIMVNSLHRQSVDRLGTGLEVTAREKNGVVQVIERRGSRFFIGVQFHPELLLYRGTFRRLFRALVADARCRRTTSTAAGETY